MGIDEAGRGPTLGPMVYGSAFCAVEDEERLKKMGFMDSKQLTEAKRDKLWAELQACGFIGWSIRVLEAKEISAGMLRRDNPYNLNAQSHDAAIELVRRVMDRGVNLRYLTVDTVGDPERYQAKLEGIFPTLSIIVAKKADSIYPIVSAGSICAKVRGGAARLAGLGRRTARATCKRMRRTLALAPALALALALAVAVALALAFTLALALALGWQVPRDTLLSGWRFEDPAFTDVDWGCGYPSDVNTKRWMRDNLEPVFGWPNICRFSWGPATEVLEKQARRRTSPPKVRP